MMAPVELRVLARELEDYVVDDENSGCDEGGGRLDAPREKLLEAAKELRRLADLQERPTMWWLHDEADYSMGVPDDLMLEKGCEVGIVKRLMVAKRLPDVWAVLMPTETDDEGFVTESEVDLFATEAEANAAAAHAMGTKEQC